MYFREHGRPHFHLTYGAARARIFISDLGLLDGKLPPRILALAVEWASIHQVELLDNWNRLRTGYPPVRIAPLE
jgi:hypothetical protein